MSANTLIGDLGKTLECAQFVTMRELNQRTASIVAEINANGRPAIVTKHGRFVAVILPLENVEIESVVLRQGPIAREVDELAARPGRIVHSMDDMIKEIGEPDPDA